MAIQGCKKRKRNPKLYSLHTFADPGCPISLSGPFRDNIRSFLQECGEIEDYNILGMPTWCTLLLNQKNNGVVIPLYTIEETVKHSSLPFCDHCRCIGWSHHFVSKRRYHIIIPVDYDWKKPLDGNVLNLHNHLLHGLIHCNGFGHLLCINGCEGGSKYLRGSEIMDLWDRICTTLRTWKITVEDFSKKRSMDLRLLYGVAYGHPWFGRWGYKFYHGSFGVTDHNYEAAIRILQSLEIDKVVQDFVHTGQDKHVKKIVHMYREVSEVKLITIGDLIRFMLRLKAQTPSQRKILRPPTKAIKQCASPAKEKSMEYREFTSFITEMASRWPARRLEYAAEVIVNALKENQAGMSRQEVRDAARLHIGDTGLLDFVIKSINNYIVGNYVVRRALNPSTRVLEFTIHEINSIASTVVEPETITEPTTDPLELDVYHDIKYLYREILQGYPESDLVGLAIKVVFDSKHLVKEWPFRDEDDELLRFMCRLIVSSDELGTAQLSQALPPGELVIVPPYATVGDLKIAAECALRDTYCAMEELIVREVEGVGEMVEDGEVLFGRIESGADVWVRGSGVELQKGKLRYEGGVDNWIVECSCGAKDDDGERMVSCDLCEVWQHTRCSGIDDSESVPPLFLCCRCSSSLMPSLGEYDMNMNMNMDMEYA